MDKVDYLQAMGIDVWREKDIIVEASLVDAQGRAQGSPLQNLDISREQQWQQLEQHIETCTACPLYETRTHAVIGTGNRQADLLIIGEAPGAQEDMQGKPFVGPAGQLLTKMLQAIKLERDDVYITNILKSRPPNNRDPKPEEVSACTPFLLKQIELIQPKVILALGRIAAHYLLNCDTAMSELRGKIFKYGPQQTRLIVTYHPAYLLRAPEEKRKAWEDLQLLQKILISDETLS